MTTKSRAATRKRRQQLATHIAVIAQHRAERRAEWEQRLAFWRTKLATIERNLRRSVRRGHSGKILRKEIRVYQDYVRRAERGRARWEGARTLWAQPEAWNPSQVKIAEHERGVHCSWHAGSARAVSVEAYDAARQCVLRVEALAGDDRALARAVQFAENYLATIDPAPPPRRATGTRKRGRMNKKAVR